MAGRPRALAVLVRGLRKRCPRCGKGNLFRGWFSMPDRCPVCALPFERGEGYWLGAMAVNLGATEAVFGALVAVILAATWPDPPVIGLLVLGVALNILFPVLFYPFSKTIFLAFDLILRRVDPDRDSDEGSDDRGGALPVPGSPAED